MKRPALAAALLVLIVFASVNLGNALYKGGDFDQFLEAGRHALDRTPLYAGSSPGSGVIGPPFQGTFFAPFAALARISDPASAILWYVLNLAVLLSGVTWWARALDEDDRMPVALWSSTALLIPLAAIAGPAQTNFEHQNMNALLLGLTGAGALTLRQRHDGWSGVFIGIAAALKAFPALLIAYLGFRGKWRAAVTATLVAAALTMTPALFYGPRGAVETLAQWLVLSSAPYWPIRVQNQSLYAMFARLWPDHANLLTLIAAVVLLAAVVSVAGLRFGRGAAESARELALSLTVAVLISPIAWDHYWVLMFPALAAVYPAETEPHGRRQRSRRALFWSAAI